MTMTTSISEINPASYADRQEQILAALALIDDLGQEACDHGQEELSARLHQAYQDVERFRIIGPKVTNLEPGDKITVSLATWDRSRTQRHNFTIGSVAHSAAESGYDVEEHIERARRLGHQLYFAAVEGFAITAHRQIPVERADLELGDLVRIDGKVFRIDEAANKNVTLFEVDQADREAHTALALFPHRETTHPLADCSGCARSAEAAAAHARATGSIGGTWEERGHVAKVSRQAF